MMKQIQHLGSRNFQRCLLALSAAAVAYRPLHLLEMQVVTGLKNKIVRLVDMEGVICMCSSFLTIRDNYIYFIHQTAKDYLTTNASPIIFPAGPEQIHYDIFLRSLHALTKILRRDIYDLRAPGVMIKDIKILRPDPDPLASIRYCCAFWLDHLCELGQDFNYISDLTDYGTIYHFFTENFLHWLESLSLIHEISSGILTIKRLLHKIQVC
jgi:hypothetical protein